MLFTTPSQFAVLALVLVAGWLFGLASHSGGQKWRDRYTTERDAHAAYRKDADARVAEARREADLRATEAERRRAEAEQDHARLAKAVPVAATTARPTYPVGSGYAGRNMRAKRGWFDWQ